MPSFWREARLGQAVFAADGADLAADEELACAHLNSQFAKLQLQTLLVQHAYLFNPVSGVRLDAYAT
jgi:hypothetical protein